MSSSLDHGRAHVTADMTTAEEVTGERAAPPRHHTSLRPAVGVVLAGLSLPLVFTSGYLAGEIKAQSFSAATALPSSQQDRAELPGPDDALRPANRTGISPSLGSEPSTLAAERSITVREGDNLWGIAASIGPPRRQPAIVRRIVALNSLDDSDQLQIGERLVVPMATGKDSPPPGGARTGPSPALFG